MMALLEQLTTDYIQAMKHREEVKKLTLNYVLAQIKNKKIELQHELTDDEVIALLKKEIKAINETISFLEKVAHKADELAEEKQKKALLETYLPQMLSREETEHLISSLIKELAIIDVKTQRGLLMKALMEKHRSELDAGMVNEILMEKIQDSRF
jgi:uncharacterized protein YqeY